MLKCLSHHYSIVYICSVSSTYSCSLHVLSSHPIYIPVTPEASADLNPAWLHKLSRSLNPEQETNRLAGFLFTNDSGRRDLCGWSTVHCDGDSAVLCRPDDLHRVHKESFPGFHLLRIPRLARSTNSPLPNSHLVDLDLLSLTVCINSGDKVIYEPLEHCFASDCL